ncbi:hypothetical protein CJ030_MR4G024547 [Morella rubra]|uniref:Uncharacterized protein n=1 Tax=Morella rubra TaxID=262757 RepID=A0A6A1VSS9_9ROSI|nr:hypothetical protein CJ030_MR4G024547 [Morella rubra]
MGKKGIVGTGLSTVEEPHGNSSDSGIFCVGSSQANYSFFYAFDRWLNKKGSQIALQKHLVSDHVVLHFGGNSGVRSIGNDIFPCTFLTQLWTLSSKGLRLLLQSLEPFSVPGMDIE